MSPSGKARDFDSLTRGFESRLPSQRPLGGGCDPLAQLAEHLTFNQGVRSSNLRWITSKFPLKSPIFGYFRGFFMPFFNRCFFADFTLFYPTLRYNVYQNVYHSISIIYKVRLHAQSYIYVEQGTVLCITRFDPRHRHQRLFARCEGPFFCSFEFTLQNTIYLLK